MAIDRAARAARRRALRAAHQAAVAREHRGGGATALGVEGLFSAAARHQQEHLAWVEVVKEDERESAGGRLDLDTGVVRMRRHG
ncbi:hypothetical protein [Saccharopolyspora sp. CA-218241]|uniref:hypothetical protein n=1 Tax=Saccharopolyspora sp. CA-218241 TaxID=3240027 RepID=UPI003D953B69